MSSDAADKSGSEPWAVHAWNEASPPRRWLFVAVAGVVGLGLIIFIDETFTEGGSNSFRVSTSTEGVRITACEVGPDGRPTAIIEAEGPGTVAVDVAFTDASGDQVYDTASANIRQLREGQTGTDTAVSFQALNPDFRCEISGVQRF